MAVGSLGGCVIPSTESYHDPSGTKVHKTKCTAENIGCFQEASQTCGGPYQVITSDSHAGGVFADWLPGPVTWYTITYRCGASDGQTPSFRWMGQEYTPPLEVIVR